jgi:hypothetical protein
MKQIIFSKNPIESGESLNSFLKFIKRALFVCSVIFLILLAFVAGGEAFAQTQGFTVNPNRGDFLRDIGVEMSKRGNALPGFDVGAHPKAPKQAGIINLASVVFYTIELLKYFLGALTVFFLVLAAIRLMTADKPDEEKGKLLNQFIYAPVAFILIMIADPIVKRVFFGEAGEAFQSEESVIRFARQGGELLRNLYGFLQTLSGTVAVTVLVFSGVQYALSAGEEDMKTQAKNRIKWALVALIIIGIAELVIFDIIFPNQGSQLPNMQRAALLLASLTNFASGFIATIAVLMIVYAGYLYIFATVDEGNAEKSKKIVISAVIGILIAFAAFALASSISIGFGAQ